jgi:hypothetical protein
MNDERKMAFISMGFDAVIERCAMLEDHIAELEELTAYLKDELSKWKYCSIVDTNRIVELETEIEGLEQQVSFLGEDSWVDE